MSAEQIVTIILWSLGGLVVLYIGVLVVSGLRGTRASSASPAASILDETALLKDLTEQERLLFQTEYQPAKKSATAGVLLAFFLGGLGAHRFYMGQVGLGFVYLLLASITLVTLIPITSVIALVECFLMPGRVRAYNKAQADAITTKLKALRSDTTVAT